MKNKAPTKLKTHPEHKLPNDKGNKTASAKKAPRKENHRVAIKHASFQVQDPKTKCVYTVFMALCAKEHKPWKNCYFGPHISKHSFRNLMLNMDILG